MPNYNNLLEQMISEQIKARGVHDQRVVKAMGILGRALARSTKVSKSAYLRLGLA